MSEKRMVRDRSIGKPLTGGLRGALARRTGKKVEKQLIVEYFGDDEDTPLLSLIKAIPQTTQDFRGGEHVHVSDAIGKCLRKIAIMRRMNMRHPQERIPDGKGITYAIGETLHDYVKTRFAKGHPDKVWADWKCKCGETVQRGTLAQRSITTCPKCETAVDQHHEVPFTHEEFDLTGSPDLLLWLSEYAAFLITEIKSMNGSQFKELVRPIPDHKVQLAFYWRILEACGEPVVDKVSILYVNKEFSFKLPYKEFMFDPREVDLSIYYEDLRALKAAGTKGALPMRVVCSNEDAPDAKECPVSVTCFGCD